MKNVTLILALTFTIACGTNWKVPRKVSKAFEKRFESAVNVTWEPDENRFLAHFEDGDFSKIAYFTQSGRWLRTTTLLDIDKLRPCIIEYIQEDYHGIEITDAELIEDLAGKKYYITIENIGDDIEDMDMDDFDQIDNEQEVNEEMVQANMVQQIDSKENQDHDGFAIKLVFDENCNFLGERST